MFPTTWSVKKRHGHNPGGLDPEPDGFPLNPDGLGLESDGLPPNPDGLSLESDGLSLNPDGLGSNPSGLPPNPGIKKRKKRAGRKERVTNENIFVTGQASQGVMV